MYNAELPPEIWRHVLHGVARSDQTKLLEVSRTFRDIALGLIFSAIKIYFIGGYEVAPRVLNIQHEDFMAEVSTKLTMRSYELLRRISNDPSFARLVRSMTVITASDTESLFEMLMLADALKLLLNLQTFRWFGTDPPLPDNVTSSLPGNLHALVLKTYVPSPKTLERLTDVVQLALPTPYYFPDDEEAHDEATASGELLEKSAYVDFRGVMNSLPLDGLQGLTLNADHLREFPIKLLHTLKDMEICVTTGIQSAGLDLILRHATVLESLTIFGCPDPDVLLWLACEPSDLPALRSFRLSFERIGMLQPLQPAFLEVLVRFLTDRPNMRRLHLRIPNVDYTDLAELAKPIREMHSLEVFGLHTGATVVEDWFIPFLGDILPVTLTALHLAIDWNGSNILFLIDSLARYPKLGFFQVYDIRTRLPLELRDVATTAPALKLAGRNRALWQVDRSGPELDFIKWPRWKVKFCTADDFEDEDHYWLFKFN